MTTIAYRDGMLAADTLSVTAGIPCRCTKLFRLDVYTTRHTHA